MKIQPEIFVILSSAVVFVFVCVIQSLSFVSLQENAIGNEGVVFLAEALKTNRSLRTLW